MISRFVLPVGEGDEMSPGNGDDTKAPFGISVLELPLLNSRTMIRRILRSRIINRLSIVITAAAASPLHHELRQITDLEVIP